MTVASVVGTCPKRCSGVRQVRWIMGWIMAITYPQLFVKCTNNVVVLVFRLCSLSSYGGSNATFDSCVWRSVQTERVQVPGDNSVQDQKLHEASMRVLQEVLLPR